MKKTDLAYIAGIVDGEGCIQLNYRWQHNTYDVQVNVTNTNQWLIEWLKFSFGGRLVTQQNRKGNRKSIYRWYARYGEALLFLEAIYPYLRLKKLQAEIVIKFLKMRIQNKGKHLTSEEKLIAEAQSIVMSNLNKRGLK